ncbi:MAG: two-component regulator propeller domain-containing protein [Cyclobacteriaceae bacterium]
MSTGIRFINTFVFLLLNLSLFAENFEHLGIADGLSHPWVKSILLDTEGSLWLGTANGLNRYDGSTVTVYRNSINERNSLSNDFVNALSLGPEGNIWIGTISGGLNKYNPKKDTFTIYRSAPKIASALPSDNITTLFLDSRNQLWVGTSMGLLQYIPEKQSFQRNPLQKYGLTVSGMVRDIYEDHLNRLWVASDSGIHIVHLENSIVKYINSDNTPLPNKPVKSIYEDEQQNIWIGTIGGGIMRIIGESEYQIIDKTNGLANDRILAISGDQNGKVYLGTEGGGLHIYHLQNDQIEITKFDPDNQKSLKSNSIHSIYYDSQSTILWIGTFHGGVNFISRWDKKFRHIQMPKLNNNFILSLSEDNHGRIHVGTDGGGVSIIDNGEVLRSLTAKSSNILNDVVLSSYIDNEGVQWYGTFQGGLSYRTEDQNSFINLLEGEHSLSDNDVNAIAEDTYGSLWLGTMNGGITQLNRRTQAVQFFKSYAGDAKSISNNFIAKIEQLNEKEMLALTGVALDIIDIKTGEASSFNARFDTSISNPKCFFIDSMDRIWIGTDKGLYCVQKGVSTIHFRHAAGLTLNYISSIEQDNSGNLWVSTLNGLVKGIGAVYEPRSTVFHLFTLDDGLPGLDFKANVSLKAKDGSLYFGCNSGLVYFNPDDIWLNPNKPKVTFTAFSLLGEEVDFRSFESMNRPIQYTDELILNYDQNIFSFEFTSSNFLLPIKNKYAYMLKGFDKDWSIASNQNFASYTNIPPGKYEFMVKSANNDGIWTEQPTTISLEIIPPWWELVWVKFLVAILFIIILILAYQSKVDQYKRNQVLLQQKVEEATQELTHVNKLLEGHVEDLISKNELLQQQNVALENQSETIQSLMEEVKANNETKLKFFTNISHELRTPLTLILGPVKELLNTRDKKYYETYKIIFDNASRLLRTVNQLLDFRKLETGNTHLVVTKTEIIRFFKDIFDSFDFLARKRQIDYQFITDQHNIIGLIDLEKMEKVLMNLISNAFKFTLDGGKIIVQIAQNNQDLELAISDSGQGIKEADQERIFDLYYEGNPYSGDKGTGLGLAIIKQFIELHHGSIEVESAIGKGTKMIIKFPLNEAAYENDNRLPDDEDFDLMDNVVLAETELARDHPEDPVIGQAMYKLLIVEDNADIRKYIKKALKGNFQIIEAKNGQEGLAITRKFLPDFIISDVMMPEMTGTEMCRIIKEDSELAHIPITLLTAYSGEENKVHGYSSGADDYMVKPFDVNLLRTKMLNRAKTRTTLVENFKRHASLDISHFAESISDSQFMSRVITIIDNNISNGAFGVDDMSDKLAMSRRNLLRKIKANTGLSVSEFIKNIRLKKAAELLKAGQFNISEVAYQTGFNDPKYFSKCFKQEFDIAPSDFLKEH